MTTAQRAALRALAEAALAGQAGSHDVFRRAVIAANAGTAIALLDRLDTAERLLGGAADSLALAASNQRDDDRRAEWDKVGALDPDEYDADAATIRTFLAAKE